MEKIDVLAIAFVISVIIFIGHIWYLKVGVNFLMKIVNNQSEALNEMLNSLEKQKTINDIQQDFNKEITRLINKNDRVNDSPTGGRRSEAKAQN